MIIYSNAFILLIYNIYDGNNICDIYQSHMIYHMLWKLYENYVYNQIRTLNSK